MIQFHGISIVDHPNPAFITEHIDFEYQIKSASRGRKGAGQPVFQSQEPGHRGVSWIGRRDLNPDNREGPALRHHQKSVDQMSADVVKLAGIEGVEGGESTDSTLRNNVCGQAVVVVPAPQVIDRDHNVSLAG